MSKAIHIHAGAHRTGTSSFQLCLAANRSALEEAGFDLAYPGRDGVPDARLKLPLPRGGVGAHRLPGFALQISEHLGQLSPDGARGLILSEENIPGPMRHFYAGRFFPFAANRLTALAEGLGRRPRHIVYVLRSYDELYASAYRKRAEDNVVEPFETLIPAFLSIETGWPDLIEQMRDLLRPETLTVLPYERRGSSVDLLHRLVPETAGLTLQEPDRPLNTSATDAALEELQRRHRTSKKLRRKVWQAVVAEYADQREPRGFASFPAAAKQQLQDRYRADLEKIANMPGVTFL